MGWGRVTALGTDSPTIGMVLETERDGTTWYECEECGLMLDDAADARKHEETCDAEDPNYIQ